MSKSRDIADSAATINFIDTVTSNVQTQLNTLNTAIGNISVTSGTLTQTFTNGQVSTISLTSTVLAPVVTVTKEVPQTGVTNNTWDVSSTAENYTRLDSAAATTLSWVGGDISEATYASQSFDALSVLGGNVCDVAFKPDGLKMFLCAGTGVIYEYALSTAFDVSSASYSSTSGNISAQTPALTGISFSPNGAKMYALGTTNDTIYEFDLSTPWSVVSGSLSYSGNSFSIASKETAPTGVTLNPLGTKVYITGYDSDSVHEFALSTAFDISSASFTSTFSVSSQDTQPQALHFNSDGTLMFVAGSSSRKIHAYNLSSAYDISSSVYNSKFLSVVSEMTSPVGFAFNPLGSKLAVFSANNTYVYGYTLPLVLSLGTGSFAAADVGKTIEANSGAFVLTATTGTYVETTAPTSYAQVASGSWSMYGVVYNTTDGDLELSSYLEGYSLSSGSKDGSNEFTGTGSIECSFLGNNGTKLYQQDRSASLVREYNLSTAYDLTTATSTGNTINSQNYGGISEGSPRAVFVSPDGVHLYTVGSSNGRGGRFDMSTPWDLSTASYVQLYDFGGYGSTYGLVFSPDGLNAFTLTDSNDDINGFSLTTAWDLTTISKDSGQFGLGAISAGSWEGLSVSTDGTKLFPSLGSTVYEVRLSTAWDITTATYTAGNNFATAYTLRGSQPIQNGLQFTLQNGNKVEMWNTDLAYIPSGYNPVHTTASTDTTYWTDINSMTADQAAGSGNVYYAISTDDRTTWSVVDDTSGVRDIVKNNAGTWQYNSNGTYASETWTAGATNTELATLAEAMEGAVSTIGYQIASMTETASLSVSPSPRAIRFNSNGTKMFYFGGNYVYEYALSSAYTVSSASLTTSYDVSGTVGGPVHFDFKSDGSKLYVLGYNAKTVYQFSLSTPFSVASGVTYDSVSFSVSSQESDPYGLRFSPDGSRMYIAGTSGDDINEYALSSAWVVSSASFTAAFSVASEDTTPYGLDFNADGTKMFVVGSQNDSIYQYSLSSAYTVSTASYDSVSFSTASQTSDPNGVTFIPNGGSLFVAGEGSGKIVQYLSSSSGYPNKMDKTQLDAVTDPNHIALGNDLDLSIILNLTSGSTVPSSNGVAINYDANIINKGAILGTDYDFDAPATNKVRITALAANNLKVRVL